jgi:hypothetical protein
MAHDVQFTIPTRKLGRADIQFEVSRGGSVLGRLDVSNGSLVWFPRYAQTGFKLGWTRFDRFMQQHAIESERR